MAIARNLTTRIRGFSGSERKRGINLLKRIVYMNMKKGLVATKADTKETGPTAKAANWTHRAPMAIAESPMKKEKGIGCFTI